MSRSRKKTPIFGNGSGSEKKDKRIANRVLRAHTTRVIKGIRWEEGIVDTPVIPLLREVSNVWDMSKDGKSYCSDCESKLLRK